MRARSCAGVPHIAPPAAAGTARARRSGCEGRTRSILAPSGAGLKRGRLLLLPRCRRRLGGLGALALGLLLAFERRIQALALLVDAPLDLVIRKAVSDAASGCVGVHVCLRMERARQRLFVATGTRRAG